MYTSHELARIAADAARQVGPYLIEAFSRPRTVELKADFHDVVTVHDKESQRRIADFLFAETPESFIVGEESSRMLTCDGRPGTPGEGDVVWYVDPIDGTSNFASGFDHWCVSIAAARGGRMSAQAVGGAVGRNPISILIPCHRVVGTNGSLTGYAGGIDKKERLLQWEGAR